jgi:squalene-hopene/tetraprenyl-beta-curcumene cyclase
MRTALWNAVFVILAALPAHSGDWSPRLAADYLDGRQKEWFAWPAAKAPGGPCISCHTGMPYLLARPALRKILGEPQPTQYEKGLLDGLRARVDKREGKDLFAAFAKEPLASQALGVESVFAALFLAREGPAGHLSEKAELAFGRMWSFQNREGRSKGAWPWFQLDLDPWETPESPFYGATLAALAVSASPSVYRESPDILRNISELMAYLRNTQVTQPLHNRLMLLWASAAMPGLWPEPARLRLVEEAFARQQADGGWTLDSLGPWKERSTAIVSAGSNSYATAVVTLALQQGGVTPSDSRLAMALNWLRSHQDRQLGYWAAGSMNKSYPAGSMQERFMQDAATAFAALALATADEHASSDRNEPRKPLRTSRP